MTGTGQTPPPGDQQRSAIRAIIRHTRRLIIAVMGSTVVLLGIALLVLPGPGLAIIALGVAILAIEFAWAKRVLERGKAAVENVKKRFGTPNRKANSSGSGHDVKDQEQK